MPDNRLEAEIDLRIVTRRRVMRRRAEAKHRCCDCAASLLIQPRELSEFLARDQPRIHQIGEYVRDRRRGDYRLARQQH